MAKKGVEEQVLAMERLPHICSATDDIDRINT